MSKNHPLMHVLGDLDELSAVLGMLINVLPASMKDAADDVRDIQRSLSHMGARLSALRTGAASGESLEPAIHILESLITAMEDRLPPLKSFILPGGHESASRAHLARTVCRRAERQLTGMLVDEDRLNDSGDISAYINRLSDYLFLLARRCNAETGITGE